MSVITNQDVLNAIRGLYQSSANQVSDAAATAKLQAILDKLGDLEFELQAIKSTDGIKKIVDHVAVTAGDDAIAALGALSASAVTDPSASGTVIALLKGLLKQLQGSGAGAAPVEVKGSIDTVDAAPVTGVKTVTAIAAEIFAGASRKSNRRYLIVKNESTQYRIRIGSSTVTAETGFPVEPGGIIEFNFNPGITVQIFAVSESANPVEAAVMEI